MVKVWFILATLTLRLSIYYHINNPTMSLCCIHLVLIYKQQNGYELTYELEFTQTFPAKIISRISRSEIIQKIFNEYNNLITTGLTKEPLKRNQQDMR